jgi:hypothetical protein
VSLFWHLSARLEAESNNGVSHPSHKSTLL